MGQGIYSRDETLPICKCYGKLWPLHLVMSLKSVAGHQDQKLGRKTGYDSGENEEKLELAKTIWTHELNNMYDQQRNLVFFAMEWQKCLALDLEKWWRKSGRAWSYCGLSCSPTTT